MPPTNETVMYDSQRSTVKPMANWMAGAVKRPGAFSAKAKRAGMSTASFARKEASAPGRLGKQARLAQTFAKFRPKKRKGSLAGRLAHLRHAGAFTAGR